MMTRKFKWLVPLIVLSLLVMSVLPSISCTPGLAVYVLISSLKCGIEVYFDGKYQGALEFAEEWGVCMLQLLWQEADVILDFIVPGSVVAESASEQGIQSTASGSSDMPDFKISYHGPIAAGGRFEVNIYHPIASTTVMSSTMLYAEDGDKLPLLGNIVVETSSQPFEPRVLTYPSITCEPSSFMAMLHPDTSYSTTMRIGNRGDTTLTYDLYQVSETISIEALYDNGHTMSGSAFTYAGTKRAIRFTPPTYPVALNTARVYLTAGLDQVGHEQFAVEVYADDGIAGEPGTMLGRVYYTPTDWGWSDIDLSGLGITITDGDFFVAYCQLKGAPEAAVLWYDTSPAHNRSWRWTYQDGVWAWRLSSYNNYMIRCVIDVSEDCPWLDTNPKSGSVEPGSWDDITITMDASGLATAEYFAEIIVSNNDPDKNPITVPVTLLVNSPPSMLSSPVPAAHAANVPIDVGLSWAGGDPDDENTMTYHVYFGTNETPDFKETVGPYSATQTSILYNLEPLDYGTVYYWQIVASDNHGVIRQSEIWSFTTEVMQHNLVVHTTELPEGQVEVAYEANLEATGGTEPYSWDWIDQEEGQEFPPGLDLAVDTGVISGTPTQDGTFNFTVEVTDDEGLTATGVLSITIVDMEEPWHHEWTGDGVIHDDQILEAVYCWLTGTPKNGHVLSDEDILWLVYCWLTGEVTPYPY